MSAEASYESFLCFFCESYFIFLENERLTKYVEKELGLIHNCYIEMLTEEFEAIKLLTRDIR